ncbi:class I SAM-dependent methyltransferase [Albimonas sp. CAU 1670]|uniref:class I SAM-dependent methyltransferase n=1 Tax=Albimonas sp. CAU 1670 TaxID=3032599 RepID=UPI0023DAD5C6|nr:class I SAM-dependent methyltransferase [Albimonas sp. CAU 1670]MDF2235503.1 class I SAM-dependent methyltransferase [Albimonas sp. CAU 1670]
MSRAQEGEIARHYANPLLEKRILEGLAAAGGDPSAPEPEALAAVDEFHTAGRAATLKVLELMDIAPGMRVLDAGCGIGGTARALALEQGVRVSGVDLTQDYVDVARALTARMGLEESCDFHQASVLDLPWPDASFDAAVTFHVAMNIPDRAAFYAEIARVLRGGAEFALFDVMAGPAHGEGTLYPLPWAQTPATSFLRTPDETAALLEGAGFGIVHRVSLKDFATEFFRKAFARAPGDGPPPLGLHLLTGEDAPAKFRNYLANLEADRLDPVIMVARRP